MGVCDVCHPHEHTQALPFEVKRYSFSLQREGLVCVLTSLLVTGRRTGPVQPVILRPLSGELHEKKGFAPFSDTTYRHLVGFVQCLAASSVYLCMGVLLLLLFFCFGVLPLFLVFDGLPYRSMIGGKHRLHVL